MEGKGAAMRATYRAVLRGNRLEWRDEEPERLSSGHEVDVFVTILEDSEPPASTPQRGAAMAAALERFAAAGGPKSFGDPAQWEREMRGDKPLPGREP
jgi:hypothetical protein